MADKAISDLTAASALATADLLHVSQSGNSRKATGQQLVDLNRAAFSGARVTLSGDLTGVNWSSNTTVTWGTEIEDQGGWWAAGSPTIMTVPSGITRIEAGAQVGGANLSGSLALWIDVDTGGGFGDSFLYAFTQILFGANASFCIQAQTGPIAVSPGNTLRVRFVTSDTSINVTAARCIFWAKAAA